MIDTSGLKALAQRRGRKAKDAWVPPTWGSFRTGMVLAFDQSLANTGFVVLEIKQDRNSRNMLTVLESEILRTVDEAEGKGGHAENLRRAQTQYRNYFSLLKSFSVYRSYATVVYESPPDGGGKLMRPESSLLSALALRIAAQEACFPLGPAVASGTHRRIVCGRSDVDKAEAHRGLATWAPALINGYTQHITNEAKRDGLSVALAALWGPLR